MAIPDDTSIATLKMFVKKIPRDRAKEVCIDVKESLRKLAGKVFPQAKVVVNSFHEVADSNQRMNQARKIEQNVLRKKKVRIPRKLFLIGGDKLNEGQRHRVAELRIGDPSLKGFYRASEKIGELYPRK